MSETKEQLYSIFECSREILSCISKTIAFHPNTCRDMAFDTVMHDVLLGAISGGEEIDLVKGKPSQAYYIKDLCTIFYFSCEVHHVILTLME